MNGLNFAGFGHYIPNRRVDNREICEKIDSDEVWIKTRTGIEARHFVAENEFCYDLAAKACERALKNSGVNVSELAYLIVCSFSPEFSVPSVACMVQNKLNIPDTCTCFDINTACAGFLYGLQVMRGLLIQNEMDEGNDKSRKYGVVIGSEVISRHLDMTDRGSCILFGDGAGAAVVSIEKSKPHAFMSGSRGDFEVLHVGGTDCQDAYVSMNGQDVFKFAVTMVPKCIREVLDKSNMSIDDIDLVICHQANKRIIDAVRTKFNVSEEKFPMNISEYGNTSAASIPILLSELYEKGDLKKGQKVILTGFGGGLTWGACYIEI